MSLSLMLYQFSSLLSWQQKSELQNDFFHAPTLRSPSRHKNTILDRHGKLFMCPARMALVHFKIACSEKKLSKTNRDHPQRTQKQFHYAKGKKLLNLLIIIYLSSGTTCYNLEFRNKISFLPSLFAVFAVGLFFLITILEIIVLSFSRFVSFLGRV